MTFYEKMKVNKGKKRELKHTNLLLCILNEKFELFTRFFDRYVLLVVCMNLLEGKHVVREENFGSF